MLQNLAMRPSVLWRGIFLKLTCASSPRTSVFAGSELPGFLNHQTAFSHFSLKILGFVVEKMGPVVALAPEFICRDGVGHPGVTPKIQSRF